MPVSVRLSSTAKVGVSKGFAVGTAFRPRLDINQSMPLLLWQCDRCEVAGSIDDAGDLDAVFAQAVNGEPTANYQSASIRADVRALQPKLRKGR